MLPREVRILMAKEWRQLARSKSALATAVLLPVLLLLVVPAGQMLTLDLAAPAGPPPRLPPGVHVPAALLAVSDDSRALLRLTVPLLVAVGGLVAPAVAASYALIGERETRTLELLAALPVRLAHVVLAKLLVIALLAGGLTTALVLVDAGLVLRLRVGPPAFAAALPLLAACALAYSSASALLTGLLARDFRAANNVNGVLFGPQVLLTIALLLGVPGDVTRLLVLSAVYLAAAIAATVVALRVVTFERLMR